MEKRLFGWMLVCAALAAAGCGDDSTTPGDADVTSEADVEGGADADAEIEEDVVPDTADGDGEVEEEVLPDAADADADADGDGDGDVTPSPCDLYCETVVDAGCASGPPTIEACMTGCDALLASCATEFGALAACAGATPTIACDASGMPIVEGCEADHAALLGCMSGGPCGSYCAQAVVAGCAMGPDTFAECSANCHGSQLACPTEFDALSTCSGDTFAVECDSLDQVSITGCGTEFDALMQCSYIAPCTAMCPTVVAAACTAGPPDEATCLGGCVEFAGNGCVSELTALTDCAGTSFAVTCLSSGAPVITGCETENLAFVTCGGS
ncbi:MAG: hypothetical protein HY907_07120 [Deltaproteobacteria bacterium]|nr:hypothetical protein [Deltaproteobacteria bacterium]